MTTTRTDPHSPKNLVTEDYSYVCSFDSETPALFVRNPLFLETVRKITNPRGYSQCHHCGVHIRYVGLLRHEPTGEIIAVGETCLQNRFDRATADFQAMRKAAELDRAAHRIKTAAEGFLANCPSVLIDLLCTADTFATRNDGPDDQFSKWVPTLTIGQLVQLRSISFVMDVRRKLWVYGELSDGQVKALVRIANEAITKAVAPAPAPVVRTAAPLGRMIIEGIVRSTRWYDNDYGSTLKMTVDCKNEQGEFTVWGTVPSKVEGALDAGTPVSKGDRVRFTATVEAARGDDATFAVFKRPTKLVVL